MPTLKRYVSSADQTGAYVLANVGGSSPITLQVSELAEKIFAVLEYQSPDKVPSKLVWSMFDVGLLFTYNSLTLSEDTEAADKNTSILDQLDLDSHLPSDQKEKIIIKLKNYDISETDKIEELIEVLRSNDEAARLPLADESKKGISLLQQWVASSDEFLRIKDQIEGFESYASASIQTFARHPYLSAPPVWVEDDWSLKYKLVRETQSNDVYICDHRHKSGHSFKILIDRGSGGHEVGKISKHGTVVDYQNKAGRTGSRINISSLTDWAVPNESILVHIPSSARLYHSGEFTEYEGEELDPIRKPTVADSSKIYTGVISRMSNSGNPVVREDNTAVVLDQGQVGEKYLFELIGDTGRVLSRFPSEPDE